MRFAFLAPLLILPAPLLLVPAPASAQAATTPVEPGMWEIRLKADTASMPKSPGIAAMVRGKTQTMRGCITEELAALGPQGMLKYGPDCGVAKTELGDGKFAFQLACRKPEKTLTTSATGTYTPTAFTAQSVIVGTGTQEMTVNGTITGRRLGACTS